MFIMITNLTTHNTTSFMIQKMNLPIHNLYTNSTIMLKCTLYMYLYLIGPQNKIPMLRRG